jgi:hypothetical protein
VACRGSVATGRRVIEANGGTTRRVTRSATGTDPVSAVARAVDLEVERATEPAELSASGRIIA